MSEPTDIREKAHRVIERQPQKWSDYFAQAAQRKPVTRGELLSVLTRYRQVEGQKTWWFKVRVFIRTFPLRFRPLRPN